MTRVLILEITHIPLKLLRIQDLRFLYSNILIID